MIRLLGKPTFFLFHKYKKLNTTSGSANTLNTCVSICPLIGLKPKMGTVSAKTLARPVMSLNLLDCTSNLPEGSVTDVMLAVNYNDK